MSFTIKGNFSGHLCGKCIEPLRNVLVKIYLAQISQGSTGKKEATNPKYTLQVLDRKTISAKKTFLLGEGKTDTLGNYEIELTEKYQAGPIAIDLEIIEVPNQNSLADPSVQFTVTTLSPVWRGGENEFSYGWNYCFPYTFWRSIRTGFDAWVICGYVKSSEDSKTPLKGVKVFAYDTDWIKDDLIGMAITDSSGRFQIDYRSRDFKQTFLSPLINVETPISAIPGPDIYFKVTSGEGAVIYEESRSEGRSDERRHISKCFYIDLCVPFWECKT